MQVARRTSHTRLSGRTGNVPSVGIRNTVRPSDVSCQALPEWMRSLLDFNNWAPKSTRIWRLQQYEYPSSEADEVDELEQKINRMQANSKSPSPAPTGNMATMDKPTQSISLDDLGELPPTGSFSEAGDDDLAKALSQRMKSLSSVDDASPESEESAATEESVMVSVSSSDDEEQVPGLTGNEMRELILAKYGKTYDCSFVRRDIPGKTFVCLNVMWQHLEQRSFRMTEEQYMEKMESIAYLLNVLGQTKKVRKFLQAPARSEKGLPRRPVVGTAISIQLELSDEAIKEFFGFGYQ